MNPPFDRLNGAGETRMVQESAGSCSSLAGLHCALDADMKMLGCCSHRMFKNCRLHQSQWQASEHLMGAYKPVCMLGAAPGMVMVPMTMRPDPRLLFQAINAPMERCLQATCHLLEARLPGRTGMLWG